MPIDSEQPDRTGLIIEALAAASFKQLIPDYLHVVLDKKYSDDPESSRMLEYIMEGRVWDFGYIYPLTGYRSAVQTYIDGGANGDFASSMASMERVTQISYDRIVAKYLDMIDMYW